MGVLSSLRLDVVVAVITSVWFIAAGINKMRYRPSGGRRAVQVPTWIVVVRRVRGVLEFLLALALLGITALSFLGYALPDIGVSPGLVIGVSLSVLALWSAVESWVFPLHALRIIVSLIGFAVAVFFTGFRG